MSKEKTEYKQNEFKITLDNGSVFFEKSRREFTDMMIEESKTEKFPTHENFKEEQ